MSELFTQDFEYTQHQQNRSISYIDYMILLFPETFRISEDKQNKIMTVTMQVTEDCSLACSYCYQTHKTKKRMSFETAKKFIDLLLSEENKLQDYHGETLGVILEFIGGEPFLEIELIDQITDYFREQTIIKNHPWAVNYMISICSNGIAYRDPKVQHYLQKNRRHLSFSITIDGAKELHDSCRCFPNGDPTYDIAHSAAQDWMSRGYYMGSKITMAPQNVRYICESLQQMLKDGYTEINMNAVYEDVWKPEDVTVIWEQGKKFIDWLLDSEYDPQKCSISFFNYDFGRPLPESENNNWCGGNGEMLACDPDGGLFPCLRYMESSLNGEQVPYKIGDIVNGIGTTGIEQNRLKELRCITRRSQSTDECFYCPIAAGCSWCTAYNYQTTGSCNKRIKTVCEVHKVQSFLITYLWNHYYDRENRQSSGVVNKRVHGLFVPLEWIVPYVGQEEYDKLKELTLKMGGIVNSKLLLKDNQA